MHSAGVVDGSQLNIYHFLINTQYSIIKIIYHFEKYIILFNILNDIKIIYFYY